MKLARVRIIIEYFGIQSSVTIKLTSLAIVFSFEANTNDEHFSVTLWSKLSSLQELLSSLELGVYRRHLKIYRTSQSLPFIRGK